MEKGYKNLGFWMLLLIPFTFFGFYKTYFIQIPNFKPENDIYIHLHALFASIWVVLLIVQPLLIRSKRFDLHRKLGKLSYIILPCVLISMIHPTMSSYSKGGSLVMPLFNIALIAIFYVLAIINKNNMGRHMRYMIGTALVFVTPTLGRVTIFWLGFDNLLMVHTVWTAINLLLIILLISDIRNKKDYIAYLVILVGFVLYQLGLYVL